MKKDVYLLLGSNMGNRRNYLSSSIAQLMDQGIEVVKCSSVYTSKAWGIEHQADFLNQVIEVKTILSPQDLLRLILSIEALEGRKRDVKWGPRVLDIDILFYDDLVLDSGTLVIPHPAIPDRRFTLVPLAEHWPKMVHPVLKTTIENLLRDCNDEGQVMIDDTSAPR